MKNQFIFLILLIAFLFSCKDNKTNPTPSNPDLATLRTDSVGGVSFTTANVYSTIVSEGKSLIIANGIVWGTAPNPTTFNNTLPATGFGVGSFKTTISGLVEGTTYYVRTYASNSVGTAYSEQKTFTTRIQALPSVSTVAITNIKTNSANVSGTVIDIGTGPVTERGFVWSTSHNPDVNSSGKKIVGSGAGIFGDTIRGLELNTTYFVRAYATSGAGTGYGNEQSFTTLNLDTNYFAVTNFDQNVLIESYTGFKNGNAPEANQNAENVLALHPGRVFIMSLHVGFFAQPMVGFTTDFRTSIGNDLDNKFLVSSSGLPKAVIQRKKYDNQYPINPTLYSNAVNAVLSESSPGIGLKTNPVFSATNNQISNYVHATFKKAVSTGLDAACYIVEDSVVDWQKDYGHTPENRPDYVHMHVLRGALTPNSGTPGIGPDSGVPIDYDYQGLWTGTLPAGVNRSHCKLITIIYRKDSNEILQVVQERLNY